MSTVITFLVGAIAVIPFWCTFGALLHAFDIDQKIITIWTDDFEWRMAPVYAIIVMFLLPAIGAYTIVKVALDNAFDR
mgnify:FL=1|jgi:hypothetical protein